MIPLAQTSQTATVPAPVKGLNFKSPLSAMPQGYAIVLDNLVCRPTHLEVRKGWQPHVTGFVATVETLVPYAANAGSLSLFAAAGAGIYDVTTAGALGAAVASGFTSAYWSYTTVSNIGGNVLIMVNGADAGQSYNGTTWGAWSITGVASTALNFVTVWKRRLWAIEKDTFRAWYLATDAVSGAMTSFDFKAIFTRGGYLVALINWTIDGGQGADDLFLAVSSEGEVAVYAGTDPASASTFALKGLYFVGKPLGQRCFSKYGGDVVLLTTGGLVPFSKYLQSTGIDRTTFFTDTIQNKLREEIETYAATPGWEVVTFLEQNLLLLHVPAADGSRYQYVMNTDTGAWTRFLLSDVETFCVYNGFLYAGDATQVRNAWTGALDDEDPIRYRMVTAFSYFGAPSRGKHMLMTRLTMRASGAPQYMAKAIFEFDLNINFPSQSSTPAGAALWGTATWGTDIWGGSTVFYRKWLGLSGFGTAAALAVEGVNVHTVFEIVSIEYLYRVGGILG